MVLTRSEQCVLRVFVGLICRGGPFWVQVGFGPERTPCATLPSPYRDAGGGIGRRARLKLAFRKEWVRFPPRAEKPRIPRAFFMHPYPRTFMSCFDLTLTATANLAPSQTPKWWLTSDLPQGSVTYGFQNVTPDLFWMWNPAVQGGLGLSS